MKNTPETVTYPINHYYIFIGFSKNDRENLDAEEKALYKKIAKMYLCVPMKKLEKLCNEGQLVEVRHEKNDQTKKRLLKEAHEIVKSLHGCGCC